MPKRLRDESDSEEENDKEFQPASKNHESSDEEFDSADEEPKAPASVKKAKKEETSEGQRNENGEEYFELSGKRRITVRLFQGKKWVDLREYYQTKEQEHKPTAKGLLLPLDQFKRLVELVPQVESAIGRL